MTTTFSTNSNNDLYVGSDGNLVMTTGLLAVRDACGFAAKTQLGEMVLNIDYGIPNFQSIWVGNPNISQFEAALKVTLLSVPDVTEVTNLSVSVQGDVLSYVAIIQTIYGQSTINGTFTI